jgi:hypothetical protein
MAQREELLPTARSAAALPGASASSLPGTPLARRREARLSPVRSGEATSRFMRDGYSISSRGCRGPYGVVTSLRAFSCRTVTDRCFARRPNTPPNLMVRCGTRPAGPRVRGLDPFSESQSSTPSLWGGGHDLAHRGNGRHSLAGLSSTHASTQLRRTRVGRLRQTSRCVALTRDVPAMYPRVASTDDNKCLFCRHFTEAL